MIIHTSRSRTREDAHIELGTTHLSDGITQNGTYPIYSFHLTISDNVNRRVNGFYKASDCISVKHALDASPWSSGSVIDGRTYTRTNPVFSIYPSDVNDLLPVVPDALWEEHCIEAFNLFSTQIPTEVSVANFTWELQELGQLLPHLASTLSKSSADGFLNYSFGWKPLLSDLSKFGTLLSSLNLKIKHLMDTWGKRTRLGYYRRELIDDVIPVPQIVPCGGNPYCGIAIAGHRLDFRASGRLFHQLIGLNTMYGDIRAFISAVGLNNPLKVVWDAIPYSFVAGWFSRIGQHLDSLAVNPYKGKWQVSDLCFSTSERIVVYLYRNEPLQSLFWSELGRVEVSRYTRIAGFPVRITSFNLSDLSVGQLTLLGALIVGLP